MTLDPAKQQELQQKVQIANRHLRDARTSLQGAVNDINSAINQQQSLRGIDSWKAVARLNNVVENIYRDKGKAHDLVAPK